MKREKKKPYFKFKITKAKILKIKNVFIYSKNIPELAQYGLYLLDTYIELKKEIRRKLK